jgi:hypothetical protein
LGSWAFYFSGIWGFQYFGTKIASVRVECLAINRKAAKPQKGQSKMPNKTNEETPKTAQTKWLGKAENCDICEKSLTHFPKFYNGRIAGYSIWALMCQECFNAYGAGLGLGLGQEYDSMTKVKTNG